jgi:beta-N-acetylhexosaminidase
MVSSATYSQLDPSNQAMFSPVIIDSLLREKLGFTGVVITDDINAAAVKPVPVADRATRFISAGGDILLTGDTASGPTLVSALTSAAAGDPAFAAKVETSVKRVLTLKASMGLVPGCTG